MLPHNCTAKFEIRTSSVTPTGVHLGDSTVEVTVRACISRPKKWTSDPAINDFDRTREWANLRVDRFPDEFAGAGDIRVEITPDGTTEGQYWNVDRVHQPASVGGVVVSNKMTISRSVRGVVAQ